MANLDGIRSLYRRVAHVYERDVIPAFGPLAADLAAWIVRCLDADLRYQLHDPFDLDEPDNFANRNLAAITALDVGTGTAVLARALAQTSMRVIGLDLSAEMLGVARQIAADEKLTNIAFVAADLHHLPLRRGAVQLVTSSFGLNASTPKSSLKALAHVLRPGGMLAFQEWGAEDDCSRDLDQTLAEYTPDDVPGLDEPLRHFFDMPKPWYDQLQDSSDYYELLKNIGFKLVWVKEAPFVRVHLPSVTAFIRYKLAWPSRRLAIEAMSEATRTTFENVVQTRLSTYANPDGSLDWSPPLFRVCAIL